MQQKKADETRKGAQEPGEELELFRKAMARRSVRIGTGFPELDAALGGDLQPGLSSGHGPPYGRIRDRRFVRGPDQEPL